MTNEQLASRIKQGDTELKPLLWERVRRITEMKARDTYSKYKTRCIMCGIELCDLYQESYTAFVYALQAYNPESKYKFVSYLAYPLKTAFNGLLGYRNKSGEPLNNSISIEQPLTDTDEQLTIAETLPDEKALDFIARFESQCVSEQIQTIIEELPEKPKYIIIQHYIKGRTLSDIAQELRQTTSYIQQIKSKALRTLRRSPLLYKLYRESYQSRNNRPYWLDWRPDKARFKRFGATPESYKDLQAKRYYQFKEWQTIVYLSYKTDTAASNDQSNAATTMDGQSGGRSAP